MIDHCADCMRDGRTTIAFVTVHNKHECRLLCWSHAKKYEFQPSLSIGHSQDCPSRKEAIEHPPRHDFDRPRFDHKLERDTVRENVHRKFADMPPWTQPVKLLLFDALDALDRKDAIIGVSTAAAQALGREVDEGNASIEAKREEAITQALVNVGIDASCGACLEIGFTGATFARHTCGDRSAPKLTERQREGMRRVLWLLAGVTTNRWDQHLRDKIRDSDADVVIAWIKSELNAMSEGKKHFPECEANRVGVGGDGLCNMRCAGLADPEVENHG